MTLRRRLVWTAAVCSGVIAVLAIVVAVQFWVTAKSQQDLLDRLGPASDTSAALILAQTNASGAVNDYVLQGDDADLAAYGAAIAEADRLFGVLESSAVIDLPNGRQFIDTAQSAQSAWIAVDAAPTLEFMASDSPRKAARNAGSDEARSAYTQMITASSTLSDAVGDARVQAASSVTSFTALLGGLLFLVGLVVIAGFAVLLVGFRNWVLLPLLRVRKDIRRAARSADFTAPITPVGPPEIASVAADAEAMRRALVTEIDTARSARDALMQDAPLVAAMGDRNRSTGEFANDFLCVSAASHAAEGVLSGDWCDALKMRDGSAALAIVDVSGHGPSAAVTAVAVRTLIRAGLEQGLPVNVIAEMCARECGSNDQFATCVLMRITPDGTVTWLNAGHHPVLVISEDKQARTLSGTGPMLSALGGSWAVESDQLQPGDLLTLFTDGIVESRDRDGGVEFDLAGVETYLRGLDGHVRSEPKEVRARLLAHLRDRAADWARDDITLLTALYRVNTPAPNSE